MGENVEALRVVLDTNTVLSAILFPRSRLAWMRGCWATGQCRPLVSRATTQELIRALTYRKLRLDDDEIEVLLGWYLSYAELVNARSGSRGLPSCRDPDDQKFLVLTASGGAEVLVTGDRALQELAGRAPFAIEPPARFKRRFTGSSAY